MENKGKLQETFEDIEIKPEDIDEFLALEAARFGATADQLKGYYAQNPSMLESLRRFKEDVKEVKSGTECGIGVKDYNDIKQGDQIEVYKRTEIKRSV